MKKKLLIAFLLFLSVHAYAGKVELLLVCNLDLKSRADVPKCEKLVKSVAAYRNLKICFATDATVLNYLLWTEPGIIERMKSNLSGFEPVFFADASNMTREDLQNHLDFYSRTVREMFGSNPSGFLTNGPSYDENAVNCLLRNGYKYLFSVAESEEGIFPPKLLVTGKGLPYLALFLTSEGFKRVFMDSLKKQGFDGFEEYIKTFQKGHDGNILLTLIFSLSDIYDEKSGEFLPGLEPFLSWISDTGYVDTILPSSFPFHSGDPFFLARRHLTQ